MRWGHLSSLVMMPNHKSSQLRVNVGWWGSASLGAMMSIPSSVSEVRLPIQRGIVAKREQSQILRVRRVETCWRSSSGRDTDSNEEAVANINSRSTTSLTFIGTVSEGREEHSFKNRTGPAGPSTGHGSGPVRWIRPEDDWTEIGPDEPAVWPVPSEPNGSTFFFYNIKDVILITPNLSPLPEGRRPDEGTHFHFAPIFKTQSPSLDSNQIPPTGDEIPNL